MRVLELQALEGQAFVDRGAEVIEERFHGIDDTLAAFTTEQAVPSGMTIFTVFKS